MRYMPAISSRYGDIRIPVSFLIGSDNLEELISFVALLKRDIPGFVRANCREWIITCSLKIRPRSSRKSGD